MNAKRKTAKAKRKTANAKRKNSERQAENRLERGFILPLSHHSR